MSDDSEVDDVETINITISEEHLDGQFDALADDFALSESQLDDIRAEIETMVDEKAPDADDEARRAMVNMLLSTTRQTLNQLDEPPESYI